MRMNVGKMSLFEAGKLACKTDLRLGIERRGKQTFFVVDSEPMMLDLDFV